MESQLFPKARQAFLLGQLDWTAGNVRAVLLADSYIPNFTEEFLADVPSNVRVATSELVLGRTGTNGIAGCAAINLGLLLSNVLCSKAAIYRDTGVEATSRLILFVGDDGLVTEPFIPAGLTYYIYPNAALGGLFRL